MSWGTQTSAAHLRPTNILRLERLSANLRSAFVHRGKEKIAWFAIFGTLAAMLFAASQVRQGWRDRRVAAESAVREQLTTAAVLIGTEAARMSGLELRALLWPALGTNGWPNSRPLTLEAFARAGDGVFATMSDSGASAHAGYFRLGRQDVGEWTVRLQGALAADSLYAGVVLDTVRRWARRAHLDRPGARIGILRPDVRGAPFVVAMAPERGKDGRAVALFGVAFSRSASLRTHVMHVLRSAPLLPRPAETVGDSLRIVPGPAVRIVYANGAHDVMPSGPVNDSVWNSRFVASRAIDGPDGGFTVQIAIPESLGHQYVAAAMPSSSEKLMLAGVLVLGLGFAVAAALGLRRQYRLAEARRMFVAAVSHELRTPLAHVNTLSETLLLGRAESPEQAKRWLSAIHREGRRLSVLTENVLLHARGEHRGLRAAPQWTDVGEVVEDALSLVKAQAHARSARIVVHGTAVDGSTPRYAWIDSAALRQIVINFVENALKFGPEGQTVNVTLDLKHPETRDGAGGILRLSVDDEGPGVQHGDRQRIWQPFVRLGGDSASAGTGLGLSVVRQLVAELGGQSSVCQVPGRGARFQIEIPLVPPPQVVPQKPMVGGSTAVLRNRSAHGAVGD